MIAVTDADVESGAFARRLAEYEHRLRLEVFEPPVFDFKCRPTLASRRLKNRAQRVCKTAAYAWLVKTAAQGAADIEEKIQSLICDLKANAEKNA
jgi:hypothetical protein